MSAFQSQIPATSSISSPQQANNHQQINIYLRRSNKSGVKIKLPSHKLSLIEIFQRVQKQFQISRQEQLLCIAGRQYMYEMLWDYQSSSYKDQFIMLGDLAIVHVHSLQLPKELSIVVECLWLGRQAETMEYMVNSNMRIVQVVDLYREEAIKANGEDILQYRLIESGRVINSQKTFQDLYIENKATIYILPIKILPKQPENLLPLALPEDTDEFIDNQKDQSSNSNRIQHSQIEQREVKSTEEEVQKDLQKIFDDDDQQQSTPKVRNRNRSFQQTYVCLGASTENLFQQIQEPNFKKKKALCLKSVHNNPQDSQYYIWRPDSSSHSHNENKLAKYIKCKKKQPTKQKSIFQKLKHKNQQEELQKPSKKLSLSARHKLKEEFQRLFQSDTIGLKINNHNYKGKGMKNQVKNQRNAGVLDIQEAEEIVFESQLSVN